MKIRSHYDGLDIRVVVVRPVEEPAAVLQIAHGMCGSKERYMPFMEFMSRNGIACIIHDHRGHGDSVKSDKDLGYMYEGGADALVDDMRLVADYARGLFPDTPLFLLGHSMGSLAARICVRRDASGYSGLILCGSPGYNPLSRRVWKATTFLCRFGMGRHRPSVMPKMTSYWYNRHFSGEGPQAWTCSDPEVRKSFRENPKNNFRFTVNGYLCLMRLMEMAYGSGGWDMKSPCMPVLFLSGEDDPLMGGHSGLVNAADAMRRAGYKDIRMKTYPSMRHEILNEIGKEDVWRDVLEFILFLFPDMLRDFC